MSDTVWFRLSRYGHPERVAVVKEHEKTLIVRRTSYLNKRVAKESFHETYYPDTTQGRGALLEELLKRQKDAERKAVEAKEHCEAVTAFFGKNPVGTVEVPTFKPIDLKAKIQL